MKTALPWLVLPLLALGCVDDEYGTVGNIGGEESTDGEEEGGGEDGDVEPPDFDAEVIEVEATAPATRADLRLKRWRQLQLDLEGALELSSDEICKEAGLYDCTDLHVVPLGGVSVANGLYRPIDRVSATTQLAMERVVLGACASRLRADLEAEEPAVFTGLSLEGSEATQGELEAQVIDLSRRLLARSPVQEELDAVVGLHATLTAEGATNADWALMACFTLGTTTEALTY